MNETAHTVVLIPGDGIGPEVSRAVQRILMVSKKHKSWQLATIAVHIKLDAFTKVKACNIMHMNSLHSKNIKQDTARIQNHDRTDAHNR